MCGHCEVRVLFVNGLHGEGLAQASCADRAAQNRWRALRVEQGQVLMQMLIFRQKDVMFVSRPIRWGENTLYLFVHLFVRVVASDEMEPSTLPYEAEITTPVQPSI